MYRRRRGIVGYVGGWEGKERVVRLERRILYTCDNHEISHRRFKHDGSSFRRVRGWRKRRKPRSQGAEGRFQAAERLQREGEGIWARERPPEGYEGC